MQAMVFVFSDGEDAATKAGTLKKLGWEVVFSGPDNGTEIYVEGEAPAAYDAGWVVLASKGGITPCD
jgi:hypothetical protein